MNTQKTKTSKRPQPRFAKPAVTALLTVLLFIGCLFIFSASWYLRTYGDTGFDSVLFTLTGGMSGVNLDLLLSYAAGALFPAAASALLLYLFLFFPEPKPQLWIPFRGRKLRLFPLNRVVAGVLAAVISLSLTACAALQVGLPEYIYAQYHISDLYQREYRDPKTTQITFPEEKRNLVYIMLESMETSYLSQEQGGGLDKNLIPELYTLAKNNVNFSHNTDVGGFVEVPGTSWTIGAMVGHTAGIPLKVPSGISDWQNGYGKDGHFLPGVTSLTSILKENGYYQTLMVGSNASFGGRKTYFETHGIDKIYDIYSARSDGTVASNYWNDWWGFEDYILFDYAKKELTQIAQQDQPFAFTMLTVDTHHIGGFTCKYCQNTSSESYENAISCSSRLVADFVQWLQEQPFYENTTVIITGDHCSMDGGYFTRNVASNYSRHVYNCFLNSAVTPTKTTNRQFCALDMFPSTLAAMGCTIDGDRLGLGTNLFSGKATLMEVYGYKDFYRELSYASDFYSETFYAEEDRISKETT